MNVPQLVNSIFAFECKASVCALYNIPQLFNNRDQENHDKANIMDVFIIICMLMIMFLIFEYLFSYNVIKS